MGAVKVIYKVIYPNGKIYVGKDLTNDINYFGSPDSARISRDFTWEERQCFTVTREILWASTDATDSEVSRIELRFIRDLKANDPTIGYNRWPALRRAGS